jgi:hypothetical protein
MSRRPIAAPTLLGVIVIVVVASITGCTSHKTSSPTSASTPATAPTTSAPTPTPTPTFVAKAYTCRSILPPTTLAVFDGKASAGFTLQKDYVERVRNFSSDLSQFAEWGGILCQWAYPNTQQSVDYGFSAITAQQTTTEQASLANNGYSGTPKYNGTVFVNSDTADYPDTYLFINGYWFYASTNSLLELIVDNVFATPDQ